MKKVTRVSITSVNLNFFPWGSKNAINKQRINLNYICHEPFYKNPTVIWHWQKTIPALVTLRPDKNLNEKKGHVANPSLHGTIKLGSSQQWDVNSVAYMSQPKSMDASYTWKHSLKAKQVCNGFLTVFSRTAISKQLDNYRLPVVFFWQTWQGFPLAPAEQFQPTNNKQLPPVRPPSCSLMHVPLFKINQTKLMISLTRNMQNDNQYLKNTKKTPTNSVNP